MTTSEPLAYRFDTARSATAAAGRWADLLRTADESSSVEIVGDGTVWFVLNRAAGAAYTERYDAWDPAGAYSEDFYYDEVGGLRPDEDGYRPQAPAADRLVDLAEVLALVPAGLAPEPTDD